MNTNTPRALSRILGIKPTPLQRGFIRITLKNYSHSGNFKTTSRVLLRRLADGVGLNILKTMHKTA